VVSWLCALLGHHRVLTGFHRFEVPTYRHMARQTGICAVEPERFVKFFTRTAGAVSVHPPSSRRPLPARKVGTVRILTRNRLVKVEQSGRATVHWMPLKPGQVLNARCPTCGVKRGEKCELCTGPPVHSHTKIALWRLRQLVVLRHRTNFRKRIPAL
jgi:hypothetical protein